MADEQQLLDDGTTLLNADGTYAVDASCCCGVACEYCDDATPYQYSVGISGFVNCACQTIATCFPFDPSNNPMDGICSIDAKFTLTQHPNYPCTWSNPDVGTITFYVYDEDADDCEGEPVNTVVRTAGASLTRTAGAFTFAIDTTEPVFPFLGIGTCFSGTVAQEDCDDAFIINDDGTCVFCHLAGLAYKFQKDATATITAL